ncbi:MAG: hypothetical protein GY765_22215 [bacterium]|nr:hypothetical protein [bacterium]
MTQGRETHDGENDDYNRRDLFISFHFPALMFHIWTTYSLLAKQLIVIKGPEEQSCSRLHETVLSVRSEKVKGTSSHHGHVFS